VAARGEELGEAEIRRRLRGERRRGYYGGVYGVAYVGQSYYLSPDQFGYTTAQAPTEGLGGGQMSTATGGDAAGGAAP
jgi:hypothetical protein